MMKRPHYWPAAFGIAAALCINTSAQLQTAGSMLVNIDPGALPDGPLLTIPNAGTAGGVFSATGLEAVDQPIIVNVGGGAKAIMFDGHNFMEHLTAEGGEIQPAPTALVGQNPVFSIEAWVINPSLFQSDIETIVSWGQRETGLGLMTFGYSSQNDHGAVDRWGGNMAWNPAPAAGAWHYLVMTFDGTTTRIYSDGVERGSLTTGMNPIAGRPITLAAQRTPSGDLIGWGGARGSLSLGKLRIQTGALTASQVSSNYNTEKGTFVFEPTPLAARPLHRYSFNLPAGTEPIGAEVPDTRTLEGPAAIIRGTEGTASFTGTRVRLSGGNSATAPYVDLPNGLVSSLSAANTGPGQISVEGWLEVTGGQTWQRYFDFGATSEGELPDVGGGGTGQNYWSFEQVNTYRDWARLETVTHGFNGGPGTPEEASGTGREFGAQNGNAPFGMIHYVATWDEASGEMVLYQNGIESTRLVTDKKFNHINDVNVWLGRSNWTPDSNLQGDYDEFRVYDRVLTPGEVINDFIAGADAVAVDPGALQTVRIQLSVTNFVAENLGQATVFGDFENVQNINITSRAGIAFTSSDTNVITITSEGAIHAVAPGTATLQVSYNGKTAGQPVTVTAIVANLMHRYSFNDEAGSATAADSIGGAGAEAILNGSAVLDGSQLVLDGFGSYAALPDQILSNATAVTIEAWASFGTNPRWARLFDFGDQTEAGAGRTYIFLSPRDGSDAVNLSMVTQSGERFVTRPGPLDNQANVHLVAEINPDANVMRLFINGALAASRGDVTIPLSLVNDVNNWIGRSMFDADGYMSGSVDEFRIYSGTLTAQRVAIDAAAGPERLVTDAGVLQSISLDLTNRVISNTSARGLLTGNFANVTNVNLFAYGVPTVTSSDTNIVTVSADGTIRGIAPGTAEVTFAFGGQNVVRSITVEAPEAVLKHRYSFNETAEDSVGDADGALVGSALISDGSLILDGFGSYVELPTQLISGYYALTIETWASMGVNGGWARLWDFGSQTPEGSGETSIFFSPHTGPGGLEMTMFVPGRNDHIGISTNLDNTTDLHIVAVYFPASGYQRLYINGELVGENRAATIQISEINDVNNWIGRSLFPDPYLNATIDEFRIYEGALSPAEVSAHFAAGPDNVAVQLTVARTGNSLRISWPAGASGFVLQTSATVDGGWANSNLPVTTEGAKAVVTDTIGSSGNKFYRLIKP